MEGYQIKWFFEHVKTKEVVPITKSPFHVGRAENMDLICRSVNVSRNHADILIYIDGSLHIKENKATNGTFVNKVQIERDRIISIKEGDEIGFGSHSTLPLENITSLYVYIAKRKVVDPVDQIALKSNVIGGQQLEVSIQSNVVVKDEKPFENFTNNCIGSKNLLPLGQTEDKFDIALPSTSSLFLSEMNKDNKANLNSGNRATISNFFDVKQNGDAEYVVNMNRNLSNENRSNVTYLPNFKQFADFENMFNMKLSVLNNENRKNMLHIPGVKQNGDAEYVLDMYRNHNNENRMNTTHLPDVKQNLNIDYMVDRNNENTTNVLGSPDVRQIASVEYGADVNQRILSKENRKIALHLSDVKQNGDVNYMGDMNLCNLNNENTTNITQSLDIRQNANVKYVADMNCYNLNNGNRINASHLPDVKQYGGVDCIIAMNPCNINNENRTNILHAIDNKQNANVKYVVDMNHCNVNNGNRINVPPHLPNVKQNNDAENVTAINHCNLKEENPINVLHLSPVEQNSVVEYVVDKDGCIVIDCESNETVKEGGGITKDCTSNTVLIKRESLNSTVQHEFNDSIFCNVKKELEDLDRYDNDFMPTYCVDSDYECSQDWDDIFELDECPKSVLRPTENDSLKNTDKNMVTRNNARKMFLEKTNNNVKEKSYDIPPIIPPHIEKNVENKGKRKPHNETSSCDQIKKIKASTFYNSKLKPVSKKREPIVNAHEIRKRKLKEIAEKSHNKQIESKRSKSNLAKVKVSDGRGSFLTTPCSLPSTNKVKCATVKANHKSGSCSNKTISARDKRSSNNSTVVSNALETKMEDNVLSSPNHPVINSDKCTNGDSSVRQKVTETMPSVVDNIILPLRNNVPLLPVSVIKLPNKNKVGFNNDNEHALLIRDVEDVIAQILTWNVSWFSDRAYNDTLPTINEHPLKSMNKSFTSYSEYYSTVMPLLMVEVWNFLYKEVDFNFSNEPAIYFTIQKEMAKRKCLELDCFVYLPKDKNIKEGDIIALQLYLENEQNKITLKTATEPLQTAVMGYVICVGKRNLVDRDSPSTSNHQSKETITNVRIMIRRLQSKFDKSGRYKPFFQHITSFISLARTIRSIKYLKKSVLCQHILRPNFDLYRVPASPKSQLYLKNELNKVQHEAVNEAKHLCLGNRPFIYLIHGPPGTGKTTVIVNIILSIIFDAKFKDKCILVTAPTNAAVDELTLRIISAKIQLHDSLRKMVEMIRIGPKNSIRPEVQDYSLYELAKRSLWRDLLKHESIENRRKLKEMKDKMDHFRSQKDNPEFKVRYKKIALEFEECCKEILGRRYNERIFEYEYVLLKGARIICTTLSSCASIKMERMFSSKGKIGCCIVDEATQSTEQETLIPLILGVDKMILVGDPKQLPALSFARESKTYGFGQSLFSRIDSNFKDASYNPIKFLNTQYRMHPAICIFPNQEFYDGKLKNATMLFNRKSPLCLLRPYLVFHFQGNTDNTEEYRNESEILCVILLLEAIVEKIPDTCKFSIGVITPYNDQKEGIIQTIKKKTFRSNVSITVNTVDSFQGRENDIIVMSCVRYHANNFLSDDQRLNVSLTRAKFALYIIGSTNLFMSCLKFGKIRKDADSRKLLKNLDPRVPKSSLKNMIFT